MKILFFNSFSAVQGGAERLLMDTVKNLLSLGHSCALVIANDDRKVRSSETWPGRVNRYYLPELLVPLSHKNIFDNYRNKKSYKNAIRYLQDIINIEKPGIIHIHNFPHLGVLENLTTKCPLVRTVHSYENLCRSRMKMLPDDSICNYPMGRKCEEICGLENNFHSVRVRAENKLMKKKFSKIIAISTWIKAVLVMNGFPDKKIVTIPNFTNLTPQGQETPEENEILFVGRITPEKGIEKLIHAVAKTKSKPLLNIVGANGILGQSSYDKHLLSEAHNFGVNIKINPWAEKEKLRLAYHRAKVVVLSSIWPEPFGLVGIEAMMHKKPVVGFDVGGVRDWLEDGVTGYIVPHLSTDTLAERIEQLLGNRALRQKMGSMGLQNALKKFSAGRHMDQLISLYKEAVSENSAY
jgi:glycosyltransferase involved in cell wall biosynthesis